MCSIVQWVSGWKWAPFSPGTTIRCSQTWILIWDYCGFFTTLSSLASVMDSQESKNNFYLFIFFFPCRRERIWLQKLGQKISQNLFFVAWTMLTTKHRLISLRTWYNSLTQNRCLNAWRQLIFIIIVTWLWVTNFTVLACIINNQRNKKKKKIFTNYMISESYIYIYI